MPTKRKLSSSSSSSDEEEYECAPPPNYGGVGERHKGSYQTALPPPPPPSSPYTASGTTAVASSSNANKRPTKRRRCSTLERGFAHLMINHPTLIDTNVPSRTQYTHTSPYPSPATSCPSSNPSIVDLDMTPLYASAPALARTPSPAPMEADYPYLVEEPTSPIQGCASVLNPLDADDKADDGFLNDVKMKSQSWYEPEKDRIVITDLDDSDEEDDFNKLPSSDDGREEIIISGAFLDRLKTQKSSFSMPFNASANPPSSTALVLFRPPLIRSVDHEPSDNKEVVVVESSPSLSPSPPGDDDAMDIEL